MINANITINGFRDDPENGPPDELQFTDGGYEVALRRETSDEWRVTEYSDAGAYGYPRDDYESAAATFWALVYKRASRVVA